MLQSNVTQDARIALTSSIFEAHAFALGEHVTVADVAAYTYIAYAPEGGIDLAPYGALRAWLERVEALPGYVPMAKREVQERLTDLLFTPPATYTYTKAYGSSTIG